MRQNATYLFEKPWREYHHSESFWSAWAALFLMSLDKAETISKLSLHRLDSDNEFRRSGELILGNRSLEDVVVEGTLRGRPFVTSGWPREFNFLQPDIVAWNSERREALLIETKTIGANAARNARLYAGLREHIRTLQPAWNVRLVYLMSHGHESEGDWSIIQEADNTTEFLLWEDLFQAALGTPFATAVCDNLAEYTEPPRVK